MPAKRYQTLGKNTHLYGRLEVTFQPDIPGRRLLVSLHAARDLVHLQGVDALQTEFRVRLYLLPSRNPQKVQESLFKPHSRTNNTYKQRSHSHRANPCPLLQQDFRFDLKELWPLMRDCRLYVAVMANSPVAPDGSGFAGCVSWELSRLMDNGTNLPRWVWLLSKTIGLQRNEPVEHRTERPDDVDPDMVMAGRRSSAPNSLINGTYVLQRDMYQGRLLYKQADFGLYLYYHGGRGAWAIGDTPGSAAPYAYCVDEAYVPSEIAGDWHVFSRQRQFLTKRVEGVPHAGVFELDNNFRCSSTFQPMSRPRPSASSLSQPQLTPPQERQPTFTREEAITLFIENQERFAQCLAILETYHGELRSAIAPEEHEAIFVPFAELHTRSLDLLDALQGYKRDDPQFASPLSPIILEVAADLEQLFVEYGVRVNDGLEAFRSVKFSNPVFGASVRVVQKNMKTNMTLPHALAAPMHQATANAQILGFIAAATPRTSPDHRGLAEAQHLFQTLHLSLPPPPDLPAIKPLPAEQLRGGPEAQAESSPDLEAVQESRQPTAKEEQPPPSPASVGPLHGGLPIYDKPPADDDADSTISDHRGSRPAAAATPARTTGLQAIPVPAPVVPVAAEPVPEAATPAPAAPVAPTRTTEPTVVERQTLPEFFPVWFHGSLSKAGAGDILTRRSFQNGDFLVRNRPKHAGEYVLTLMYKGVATNHLIARDPEGMFAVNKRRFGDAHSLVEMIDNLRKPRSDWPELCRTFIPRRGAAQAEIEEQVELGRSLRAAE